MVAAERDGALRSGVVLHVGKHFGDAHSDSDHAQQAPYIRGPTRGPPDICVQQFQQTKKMPCEAACEDTGVQRHHVWQRGYA